MRVFYEEMFKAFKDILITKGFTPELAAENAELFANNSLDGVYTHGLNRFPRVIECIEKGYVVVNAAAECVNAFGALEQWDGKRGIGPSNAKKCMSRAVELAAKYGIGCVALRNTNHWMRGGAYGLQAADAGYVGICFTNTLPNVPPWGATEPRIGNNPFVISMPKKDGHVMLDMAMSQYSFGAIEKMAKTNELLPVAGGYDVNGNLTNDPKLLWESRHVLPIGYWKGSGMSIMLDLLASVLSQGNSVRQIGGLPAEINVCQVFIAVRPDAFGGEEFMERTINETLQYIKGAAPAEGVTNIRFPNENSYKTRLDNLKNGIPVDESYWNTVKSMLNPSL